MARNAAIDKYIEYTMAADELADEIALFLADHGEIEPDDVTWSSVSRMEQVVDDLRSTLRFIRTGMHD